MKKKLQGTTGRSQPQTIEYIMLQQNIKCTACGATNFSLLYPIDGYYLYRCDQCSLEMLHPQPDDQALFQIYNAEYQLAANTMEERKHLDEMKAATAKLYLKELHSLPLPVKAKMLEVGCGWGHFLSEAASNGYDVHGIELSTHAAEEAQKRVGTDRITNGTIEGSDLPKTQFNICVMIDVIEHVRNPLSFLETIHSLLAPGGYLFMVTPSTDSLSAKILGRHWMEYKAEHLYSFSRKSMSALLARTNFDNVEFRPAQKALNYNFIEQYLNRFTVPILTPLLNLLGKPLSSKARFKQITIPAGGMISIARAPGGKRQA